MILVYFSPPPPKKIGYPPKKCVTLVSAQTRSRDTGGVCSTPCRKGCKTFHEHTFHLAHDTSSELRLSDIVSIRARMNGQRSVLNNQMTVEWKQSSALRVRRPLCVYTTCGRVLLKLSRASKVTGYHQKYLTCKPTKH